MNTNWEKDLKQLNSTNGMFTPEIKQKIVDRLVRKERIQSTLQYIGLIGLLSTVCLVGTLYSKDIMNGVQNVASGKSNQTPEQTNKELELLTLVKDIPIYPGLKKRSGTLYTYYIEDTSLVVLMNYYDIEMQKRNWKDFMPKYKDGKAIIKSWSNDKLLIELEFYKIGNESTIEFNIYPKEANTQNG